MNIMITPTTVMSLFFNHVVDLLVAHGSQLDACNAQRIPAYLMKTSKPEHQLNMSFHLLWNHGIISFIAVQ